MVQIINRTTVFICVQCFSQYMPFRLKLFFTDPVHNYHELNHQPVPWPNKDKSICNLHMPSANFLTAVNFKSHYANQTLRNKKLLNLKQWVNHSCGDGRKRRTWTKRRRLLQIIQHGNWNEQNNSRYKPVPVEQYPGSLEPTAGKGMPLIYCLQFHKTTLYAPITSVKSDNKLTAEKTTQDKKYLYDGREPAYGSTTAYML